MAMDMLEFEEFDAGSSITARGSQTILSMDTSSLPKSFLIKKMEINFVATPNESAEGSMAGATHLLGFNTNTRSTAVDSIAEQLDARIDDIHGHQGLIWAKAFYVHMFLDDNTNHNATDGNAAVINTTKSFPKGFRLDKDEQYNWLIFNPSGSTTINVVKDYFLRVRFWGVYIE